MSAVAEATPQGGPLSRLLSNIMLNELGRELARRGLRFVRYANLRKRGVGRELGLHTADSICGPCRLAISPAHAIALPNVYFDSLGLTRLTVL